MTSSDDPRADEPGGDRRDLRRRLAQAEDDFRKSLPDGPMVVDARKAEVFERRRAERLEQLAFRLAVSIAAVLRRASSRFRS